MRTVNALSQQASRVAEHSQSLLRTRLWAVAALAAIMASGLACSGTDTSVSPQSVISPQPADGKGGPPDPAPYGALLGTYDGVEVRSNQRGITPPDNQRRGTYGLEYECVEFVNRFYAQVFHHSNMSGMGNANDYFGKASALGLAGFENGGTVPPRVNDIMAFKGGKQDPQTGERHGHVAIIREVTQSTIVLVQQNYTSTAPADLYLTDTLVVVNGHYIVGNLGTGADALVPQGWLREPGVALTLLGAPPAGGTETGAGSYPAGASVPITATPATGYSFACWYDGSSLASSSPTFTYTMPREPHTLVALFTVASTPTFSVTLLQTPQSGGTLSGGGSYPVGATVTVTGVPAAGYSFTGWYENAQLVQTNGTFTFTMPATSRTLLAQFTAASPQAMPVVKVTASPSTIATGESTTISWTSTNATSCSGQWDAFTSVIGASGSKTFQPASSTTYVVRCSGPGGTANDSKTVTVNTHSPTILVTASPATITASQRTTVGWSSSNTTNCNGSWDGYASAIGTAGSRSFQPSSTTSYTVICNGPGGSVTASQTVTVTPTATPGPTVTVAVSPSTIQMFQSTTVSWSSTNATTCSGQWDNFSAPIGVSGSRVFQPTSTTIYMIRCTGAGGSASDSRTVSVSPPAMAPILTSVSPSSLAASSANQTLSIYGSNFQSTSTLSFVPPEGGRIASTAAKLTFVSSTQLSYQFNSLSDAGPWSVTVINPDGQQSASATFVVTPPSQPGPTITSVSPASMTASASALNTLVVSGANFSPGSQLQFTDPGNRVYSSIAHPERVIAVSPTQWVYQINNGGTVGTWEVRVINPDGTSSNTATFVVH